MKHHFVFLGLWLLAIPGLADVRVFVESNNGTAWIKYECTAGEVVRAFALDVSVDQGQILGISDYFVGESRADVQGYGIFPASFRDHITVDSGQVITWDVSGYTPLAAVADRPGDTLPGLHSSGVSLEFGGLWKASVPAAVPGPVGTLCALHLSESANVSVTANSSRGGLVPASPGGGFSPVFTGAFVDVNRSILEVTLDPGVITVRSEGGELQTAVTLDGEWIGTGDTSGEYSEAIPEGATKYYRVRRP